LATTSKRGTYSLKLPRRRSTPSSSRHARPCSSPRQICSAISPRQSSPASTTLRVFVNVPQVLATDVKVGQKAIVYRRKDPKWRFVGAITRTADALDTNTRTLLTEVQLPNEGGALRPGMYLQVMFIFERKVPTIIIPAAALATRSDGPWLGVLDEQHHVHYRKVRLGRDFGTETEVVSGVEAGETVVVHPGDDLPEGTQVEPLEMRTK
jgi:RND family efflux transporter MFP subunit